MTTAHKVSLVETVCQTRGLAPALAAMDLPRSTWYYHRTQKVSYEDKYAHLLPALEAIAREHPGYGWPRVTMELRETYGHRINHKVVQRLLKLWDLQIVRLARRPKPGSIRQAIKTAGERANLVAQLDEIGLFQVVYTDFTELRFAGGSRKAQLMPIVGHVSKMAYGWAVGETPSAALALLAWQRAKKTFEQLDIPYAGMIMHHDQGSAFISHVWTAQLLLEDHSRLSYALRGAKDNPEMEAFHSRFKAEGHSLFLDAQTMAELSMAVDQRMGHWLGVVVPQCPLHDRSQHSLHQD